MPYYCAGTNDGMEKGLGVGFCWDLLFGTHLYQFPCLFSFVPVWAFLGIFDLKRQ